LTGQCKFDGNEVRRSQIYFVFFFPPQKKERNPTHIAHIAKAPQPVPNLLREANATTKALPKSAILPTHSELTTEAVLFILQNEIKNLFL
jgi:hypothetical protein